MVKGIKTIPLRYTTEQFNDIEEKKNSSGKKWEDFIYCSVFPEREQQILDEIEKMKEEKKPAVVKPKIVEVKKIEEVKEIKAPNGIWRME